jgi:hypothetical protein
MPNAARTLIAKALAMGEPASGRRRTPRLRRDTWCMCGRDVPNSVPARLRLDLRWPSEPHHASGCAARATSRRRRSVLRSSSSARQGGTRSKRMNAAPRAACRYRRAARGSALPRGSSCAATAATWGARTSLPCAGAIQGQHEERCRRHAGEQDCHRGAERASSYKRPSRNRTRTTTSSTPTMPLGA